MRQKKITRKFRWIYSVVAMFLLASCAPADVRHGSMIPVRVGDNTAVVGEDRAVFAGVHWDLVQFNSISIDRSLGVTLLIDEQGDFTGYTGCNEFTVSPGDEVSISERDGYVLTTFNTSVSQTLAYCVHPRWIMGLEDKYLNALSGATKFYMDDGQLVIVSYQAILRFAPAEHMLITETDWFLVSLQGGDGWRWNFYFNDRTYLSIAERQITRNEGGCHVVIEDIILDITKKRINFEGVALHPLPCRTEAFMWESRFVIMQDRNNQNRWFYRARVPDFVSALNEAESYEIIRDELSIFDETSQLLIELKAVEMDN